MVAHNCVVLHDKVYWCVVWCVCVCVAALVCFVFVFVCCLYDDVLKYLLVPSGIFLLRQIGPRYICV